MCGFVGFLDANIIKNDATLILHRMANKIISRGPDDLGVWSDKSGIGLGHRRLSILDLSQTGHQPMVSTCNRYVLVFNGEIYNHLDLRALLAKDISGLKFNLTWRGHSDTETLLAGFANWGIHATIDRCIGMFAFAVWDRKDQQLTLGRDRMGEKPIYYGWQGIGDDASFVFGSELKALKAHPAFSAEVSRDALRLFMMYSYVPGPHSIYQGIFKLSPGCLLQVSLNCREPTITTYWSLQDIALAGSNSPLNCSTEEMVDSLENLLKSVVREQMVADVSLGAFLSGGIDSSTLVALMQEQSVAPVKTFTIGFNEAGYNEAHNAKLIARHLGTDHTDLYVTPRQAIDVIPKLPTLYCEPFADSSQIPTFLVSQLARKQVKVSISGDGGDELFAGYNRYLITSKIWNRISHLPIGVRSLVANGILKISPDSWDSLLGPMQQMVPKKFHQANIGDKLHKGAGVIRANSVEDLYLGLTTHWKPQDLVIGAKSLPTALTENRLLLKGLDDVQRMMLLDAITYLPDDVLVKVDRASMGVSLEGRMPFLDHRLVEFAWRVPQALKLKDGVGKWILREVLYRHVPKGLIERPKMGFGVPIGAWLRGPLKDWAEVLLDEVRLRKEGYFDPVPIRSIWKEHLSGKRNWQHHLWNVLMFQSWLEAQN